MKHEITIFLHYSKWLIGNPDFLIFAVSIQTWLPGPTLVPGVLNRLISLFTLTSETARHYLYHEGFNVVPTLSGIVPIKFTAMVYISYPEQVNFNQYPVQEKVIRDLVPTKLLYD